MTMMESQPHNASEPSVDVLSKMIHGFQISQMIYVAAKLGIADLLADVPRSSSELAQATETHAPSLYRLLRALASLGIFAEDDQGRFGLTSLACPLQQGVPDSLHNMAVFNGDPYFWRAWGDLLHSVTTGEPAVEHIYGMKSWEYRAQNPDLNALMNNFFTEVSMMDNTAIVSAYDFSGIGTLVDVAGGHGSLIAAILNANPTIHGILFDQPHVIAGAQPVLEATGVAQRCELVAGDMFASVPGGGDAYLLKSIVHDWNDDQAVAILSNCRRAMKQEGKLLVVESVIPPGNNPHSGKLVDITMLVAETGRERTEDEFKALFTGSGFTMTKLFPTQSRFSVIEAAPN